MRYEFDIMKDTIRGDCSDSMSALWHTTRKFFIYGGVGVKYFTLTIITAKVESLYHTIVIRVRRYTAFHSGVLLIVF